MNKNSINNVVEFMVKVLIVAGIVIGVIIFTLIILFVKDIKDYHERGKEKMQVTANEYPDKIKKHLVKKYGKKFIINPNWKSTGGGSPIPFSEDGSSIYYEVYAEDASDCPFRVYVYPVSEKDRSIEEIRDNYCWKFLRENLRKKFKERLDKVLPEGYKLSIETVGNITFENYVTPASSTEEYFKSNRFQPTIYIYIYTHNSENEEEQRSEESALLLLNEFKDNIDNISMKFTYYVIENKEEFDSIDVLREEKKNLMVYGYESGTSYKQIRSMEKEEKFKIEINSNDKEN